LYFLIISTLLNAGLVVLFVAVFKWGIEGAAWATVIAQGVSFILSVIYLNRTHEVIRFSFRNLQFDWDIFKKSLKIGIPSGLQQTFVALGMMALMRIVNGFGTNTIAAYTVAGRIDSFASMPAMNFGMALSTFVGQNMGAGKPERVSRGFRETLWMTTIISVTVTAAAILFGSQLMSMFTPDPDVIRIGHRYLIIVSAFYIIFSAMMTSNGVMRGAGDTLIPMFITLFSLWILRVPISYWLSKSIGTDGIWWSIPIAWVFGFIFSYLYYLSGRWKRKVIVKPSTNPEGSVS
jgi:putative MATE family efflux protein